MKGEIMSRPKFRNKKTVIDGIRFDSKLEARRYIELQMLEKAGEISDLLIQPEYVLQPLFRKNGKTYRKIVYRADFSYYDKRQGKYIVEDTKGFQTDVYRLKKKLFEYRYPDLEIVEVFQRGKGKR